MKKIEGVVVYYDDGSRERLSAQQIMERFFGGFTQDPSQNTNGEGSPSLPTEPMVTEPEKPVTNVDFVKGTDIVSENIVSQLLPFSLYHVKSTSGFKSMSSVTLM